MYLYQLGQSRYEWFKLLIAGQGEKITEWKGKMAQKLKEALKEKAVATLGSSDLELSKINLSVIADLVNAETAIKTAQTLKSQASKALEHKVLFFMRADKGKATFPTGAIQYVRNPEKYVRDEFKPITVSFQLLEAGFENTVDKQNIVAKMKSMEMKEVDIPRTPHIFSFNPLPMSESSPSTIFQLPTDDIFNFQFYYSRTSKKGEGSLSEVKARLQDMQVLLQSKPSDPSKKDQGFQGSSLPDLQELFQKLVNMLDSKREKFFSKLEKIQEKAKEKEKDILTLKENLQNIKFDLRWNLEMGDCEIALLDADGKARGAFRVHNSSQVNKMMKKFIDTENQLVHTKMSLAQSAADSESQVDELRHRLKEMEEKVKQLEASKFGAEEKYVEAKMALSEMAMRNADLERINFELQKK